MLPLPGRDESLIGRVSSNEWHVCFFAAFTSEIAKNIATTTVRTVATAKITWVTATTTTKWAMSATHVAISWSLFASGFGPRPMGNRIATKRGLERLGRPGREKTRPSCGPIAPNARRVASSSWRLLLLLLLLLFLLRFVFARFGGTKVPNPSWHFLEE